MSWFFFFFNHIRKKKNYLWFSLSYGNTDGRRSNSETSLACPFTLLSQFRIRLSIWLLTLAHRWHSSPQLFSLDKRISLQTPYRHNWCGIVEFPPTLSRSEFPPGLRQLLVPDNPRKLRRHSSLQPHNACTPPTHLESARLSPACFAPDVISFPQNPPLCSPLPPSLQRGGVTGAGVWVLGNLSSHGHREQFKLSL